MEFGKEDQARLESYADVSGAMSDSTAIRPGFELDILSLETWLNANIHGFCGPVSIEQFSGGQSNPTFKLVTPRRSYVLRRKPMGILLKGAHAIDREARVMQALECEGFPVPHVYALCTDDSVIGSWFYVMDFAAGRIFWDGGFPGLSTSQRGAHQDAVNAAIAALHNFDPLSLGLDDYGRSGRYLERQIARWSQQYLEDDAAGRLPDMDFLVEWLPAHVPAENATRIVHGDFRIDNIIFHPNRAEVLAVLDWELSTLGDPVVDFAYNLMMYRVPSVVPWGLAGRDLAGLGLPDEAAYVAAYCRRTGRDVIANLDVYLAFNLFRLAAIIHGIKGRIIRGTAASADAAAMVARMELLAEVARSIAAKVPAS